MFSSGTANSNLISLFKNIMHSPVQDKHFQDPLVSERSIKHMINSPFETDGSVTCLAGLGSGFEVMRIPAILNYTSCNSKHLIMKRNLANDFSSTKSDWIQNTRQRTIGASTGQYEYIISQEYTQPDSMCLNHFTVFVLTICDNKSKHTQTGTQNKINQIMDKVTSRENY